MTLPAGAGAGGAEPAWHLFVIRSDRVDAIAAELSERQIGSKIYYRPPVHRHPAMAPFAPSRPLSATDQLALTHLAVPFGPTLTREDASNVTRAVAAALGEDS